jgi:hypothetical protein
MATTTARKNRKPNFDLGDETTNYVNAAAAQAIRKAVEDGREICKMAPREFWIDICDRAQDEWADYIRIRGAIAWSFDRINDILAKAEVKDGFGAQLEVRYAGGIKGVITPEMAEEFIRQAAKKAKVNLTGHWQHFADYSTENQYNVSWFHVTEDGRFGIGN